MSKISLRSFPIGIILSVFMGTADAQIVTQNVDRNLEGTWQLSVGVFNWDSTGRCIVKIPTGGAGASKNAPVRISRIDSSRYTLKINAVADALVSGNRFAFTERLGSNTLEWVGTISRKIDQRTSKAIATISGIETCNNQATLEFTFLKEEKTTDYTILEPKPKDSTNPGLTSPSPSYMKETLGVPGQLSENCSPVKNTNLKKLIVTESVGPFRATGLKPAILAVRRVLDKVKIEKPDLYEQLGTEGMLCVRKIRGGSDFSNHSWGTAIDIKINNKLDVRGDDKTQVGLKELYPYFHEEGFYWGAAFPTEDSMHFEASKQLIETWKASGVIP